MEIEFVDYEYNGNKLSFTIKDSEINGILSKNYHEMINILKLRKDYQGTLMVNKEKISKEEINLYRKRISVVPYEFKYNYFCETVYDLMIYEIKRKNIKLKNSEKKIKDSLVIVGLEENYLERKITTLSSSEKKLVRMKKSKTVSYKL